ncbi:PHP domain-containing protein [Caldisalinibacter kiritimatiensis]|uniref:Histidinol phosphatase n=1 Tax=Caldisalinibacter kiritimatiensis TaxID=1304284 RepID=R1CDR1_9FIRM|nr:PHP domain-containing protein [Caldisalinibacter kiritimatiensis]EOD00420.1 Histidinol phosphatase [Caldisalinibacter kiritimatiensis]
MRIFADYHTHTIYSHGKGTIKENVESAISKGLKEIAIADHGPSHIGFGVKKKNFIKMREEIDKLNQEYKDIKILLGVESNIISYDGTIDIDDDILKYLDILLVGFHFGAKPQTISDAYNIYVLNYLGRVSKSIAEKARFLNTKALINAINKYDIDIITHPGAKVDIDTKELAKAAAKRGTALEINASHGQLSLEYLKIAMTEKVKFVISSDAHTPKDVGNVEKAIQRAVSANLKADRIINAVE